MTVVDEWFLGQGRTETEQRFLLRLRTRARDWYTLDVSPEHTQAWTDHEPLYVHVDVVDHGVVGTLRVDFDGQRVLGHWGAADFCDTIDPTAPESLATPLVTSPEEAADHAADWLEAQLHRPLERREWWQNAAVIGREWVLADTHRVLCMSGQPGALGAAPDAVRIRPATRPTEDERDEIIGGDLS